MLAAVVKEGLAVNCVESVLEVYFENDAFWVVAMALTPLAENSYPNLCA